MDKYNWDVTNDRRKHKLEVILINKNKKVVKFNCIVQSSHVRIELVSLHEKMGANVFENDNTFMVPFDNLSRNLQNSFADLLYLIDLEDIAVMSKYLAINQESLDFIKFMNASLNVLV